MTTFGEMYKAHMAQTSASIMYQADQRAARQPNNHYVESSYGGLGQYETGAADKLGRRQGESPESWRRRVIAVGRHLPEEELAARLAAIDAAEQVQSHQQLRAQLSERLAGSGVGIMGRDEQAARRAAAAAQSVRANSMGQAIAQNGHLVASTSTPGQPSLSILDRMPREEPVFVPQRTDISQMRSSGEGWTTR